MSDYVLDASALLALLRAEKGTDLVQDALSRSVISGVNLAEVVTRLAAVAVPENEIKETLRLLGLKIIPFEDQEGF